MSQEAGPPGVNIGDSYASVSAEKAPSFYVNRALVSWNAQQACEYIQVSWTFGWRQHLFAPWCAASPSPVCHLLIILHRIYIDKPGEHLHASLGYTKGSLYPVFFTPCTCQKLIGLNGTALNFYPYTGNIVALTESRDIPLEHRAEEISLLPSSHQQTQSCSSHLHRLRLWLQSRIGCLAS